MLRGVAVCVAVLLAAAGCSDERPPHSAPPPGPSPKSDGAESPRKPRARRPTRPAKVAVDNLGNTRADRGRVARSIRLLKGLGFWDDLTDHLGVVIVRTRPGARRIPTDGHLADSLYTVQFGPGPDGLVCDIVIYSRALADDVVLQSEYYDRGLMDLPPPTIHQFWAVILGHELAHCTDRGQEGERRSTRWEHRILRAMGAGRIPGNRISES